MSVSAAPPRLVIAQTDQIHDQIVDLLEKLRQSGQK